MIDAASINFRSIMLHADTNSSFKQYSCFPVSCFVFLLADAVGNSKSTCSGQKESRKEQCSPNMFYVLKL